MTNMGKNGKNTGDRHNKWTEAAEAGLLFGAHMLAGGLCWLLLVTRRPLECGLAVWRFGLGLWQHWWWLGTNSKPVDPHISTRHGHSCVPTQVPLADPDKEKSLCWQQLKAVDRTSLSSTLSASSPQASALTRPAFAHSGLWCYLCASRTRCCATLQCRIRTEELCCPISCSRCRRGLSDVGRHQSRVLSCRHPAAALQPPC